MNRYEGKNIVITGASAGIGQATAVRFIAEGATVMGLGRSAEGLKETEGMVADASRFRSHHVDMEDGESIAEAARAAGEALDGRVDVLCNVAGMTVRTPIDDFDTDLARRITQVNFFGPMQLISEVLPMIPENRPGHSVIVNVASNSATQAVPTLSAYAGSKAALISASLTLAVELAPKRIRVIPLSPSGVQTKMMWNIWEQVKDYEGDWYGRMIHLWGQEESGQADELAGFIAFAASEEAKYWNGSQLLIDGGARSAF